eukprot:CAMPEP_0115166776 /NCGR_PEP_ID=MMETSP0227-20121206/74299_1 /TAXON_ID=89957 /ORGANISM="Polarella glacialis, Strain CCMP 1383" /LENGTH=85 /DNA_ID=CAMNT_0002579323 /DNA_START=69 /DNA_END=326 /DNA_ORIENTATION=+
MVVKAYGGHLRLHILHELIPCCITLHEHAGLLCLAEPIDVSTPSSRADICDTPDGWVEKWNESITDTLGAIEICVDYAFSCDSVA